MRLIPIKPTMAENEQFAKDPNCKDSLEMSVLFFQRTGYRPPWIGYYAEKEGQLVGSAAFKGPPVDGQVEIAYVTFPPFRRQGVATKMCALLVQIAQQTDPHLLITARTLPKQNWSTRILERNQFVLQSTVEDREDGEVWVWHYAG